MQFFDRVKISVQSGAWGNGMATWRREAYVAYWGPAWGDWWNWWSIYFVASSNEYTLMPFRANKIYKASSWEHGQWKDRYGKGWEDLTLIVPVGTIISDTETGVHYAVLETPGARCCIVKWGKWWLGNKHFVDAQKQYSTIAFLGEPAQKREITLELQLLSDVALIGSPSVGKSSLINTYSNSKAKVAEYHFTTLTPNLGIVSHNGTSFSMIDIPGLIEWAHEGKWLWYEFLRHIIKSRALLFVSDLARFESWIKEIIQIIEELRLYCEEQFGPDYDEVKCAISIEWDILVYSIHGDKECIMKKQIAFVCNKVDLVFDEEVVQEIVTELHKEAKEYFSEAFDVNISNEILEKNTFIVSAATNAWKEELLTFCARSLDNREVATEQTSETLIDVARNEVQEPSIKDVSATAVPELIEDWYLQEDAARYPQIRHIDHPKVWYYSYVIPRWNDEAELWFRSYLAQHGIMDWFQNAWMKKWDVLKIVSPYKQRKDLLIRWD